MPDHRTSIQTALQAFQTRPLRDAALDLLDTLGYRSDKILQLPDASPATFHDFIREHNPEATFSPEKALFDDWISAELLFQLTDSELSGQSELFDQTRLQPGLLQSYLFFAIELKGGGYPRGKLTALARQINRVFPMPVMLLIKHKGEASIPACDKQKGTSASDLLSIAVINRRQNKRDAHKDVLGKVTIIRDISLREPHRGHLDILDSFAFDNLVHPKKLPINSFDHLHAAWEEVFNVDLLNEKFYRELSSWYFWALQNVHFPHDELDHHLKKNDLFANKDKLREHDAKNLIRLLTRLLFVWFVKEKGLVPTTLFDQSDVAGKWLNTFDPEASETRYYKAILQNLFFATLNQSQGKREFRKSGRQHRNITNLMRYEHAFKDPQAFVEEVESVVPFMNGGLFECLDKPHPTLKGAQGGDVILYEDGFSDREDNPLSVPDFLFFGEERQLDLSDVLGDKKRGKEKVRGIISILNRYKFTIVENTPIDQEIALDPELLGKVFENLLASYNPETKTTARKQTGSFYTPRSIVEYMVDESIKAYLRKELCKACPQVSIDDAQTGLEILFAYTEREHAFSEEERMALIKAIDNCKILDPACGSGAFPVGILHKMEFILGKLDKNNQLWRDRQINKVDATITAAEEIEDSTIREQTLSDLEAQKIDIQEAFDNNALGYGRKLYLIENCIYGVDIQSIATQVSKLRFFISLIVDQKVDKTRENFGIRPLPNLETKFVSADTLIRIEKPAVQGDLFENEMVKEWEKELKTVRHHLFGAKTPKTKRKYREQDKEIRERIAGELKKNGWSNRSAQQLADWDPYDQNASCPFFDPEWMFDLKGFDVVLGNPPYVQIQKFAKEQKDRWIKQGYQTYAATADIYCLFYERGAELLNERGYLYYITSNKWMRAGYGDKLRDFLSTRVDTEAVFDFGMAQNFGAATTYTCIVAFENTPPEQTVKSCYATDDKAAMSEPKAYFEAHAVEMDDLDASPWVVVTKERYEIKKAVEAQGVPLEKWDLNIYRGVLTGLNDAFYLTQEQRDDLIAKEPHAEHLIVPLLRGRFVGRYQTNWDGTWMINSHNGVKQKGIPRIDIPKDYPVLYEHMRQWEAQLKKRQDKGDHWTNLRNCAYVDEFLKPKIMYPNMTKYLPFYYDEEDKFFGNQKCFIISSDSESLTYLTAVLNSSLFKCCFKDNFPELLGSTYELSKIFFDKIPIKKPSDPEKQLFEILVPMVQRAKREKLQAEAAFLGDLIDACVLESYFPEEASAKNLLFIDQTLALLSGKPTDIRSFIETINAPTHPIRNQLLRLTAESPELFRVLKEEGRV